LSWRQVDRRSGAPEIRDLRRWMFNGLREGSFAEAVVSFCSAVPPR